MPHQKSIREERQYALLAIAIIAIFLRVLYFYGTEIDQRGHDVGGHIEYIEYLREHRELPERNAGWEFYQPPLYYVSAAVFTEAMEFLYPDSQMEPAQYLSLLFSFVTFLVCAWIAKLLFPKMGNELLLFLALLATIPEFIMGSQRVNNDTLYQLLAFVSVVLMLQFWKKPQWKWWIALSISLGLGTLTKTNTLLLVPPALALCLLHPKIQWKETFAYAGTVSMVVLLLAGWFILPPFFSETTPKAVVGNIDQMTGAIPSTPEYLFTFNPFQVLLHPFNNVYDDIGRRQYHLEYLFRSMFFGEVETNELFQPFGLIIISAALLLLPFVVFSFWNDVKKWTASHTFPLVLISIAVFLGSFGMRILVPFSSSSPFRYSTPLYIAFAFYALIHTDRTKPFRFTLVTLLSGVSAAFLLVLITSGY